MRDPLATTLCDESRYPDTRAAPWPMQPAFAIFVLLSPPTAAAFGPPGAIARVDGAQPIEVNPHAQRIDQYAVRSDRGQHRLPRPVEQRIELDEAAALLIGDEAGLLAPLGLIGARR